MIDAFNTAVSGAGAFQSRLNVNADNLANINTEGYQSRRAGFTDLMYSAFPAADQNARQGSGTRISGVSVNLSQGRTAETGRTLDAAIAGNGYFCVQGKDGEVYYTRSGDFKLSPTQNGSLLVTADGDAVLDQTMKPVQVGPQQEVILTGPSKENDPAAIRLAVVDFANPSALARDGGGRLYAGADSGNAALLNGADVRQGTLEYSNVDAVSEMQGLILSQRGFALNTRMITTADELEQTANSLR